MKTKRIIQDPCLFIFWLIFSFFHIYFFFIQNWKIHSKADYLIVLFNVIVITLILYPLSKKAKQKIISVELQDRTQASSVSDTKYYLYVWIIHFVCWVPVFLAYYPGLFNYDVSAQITQTWGSYSSNHPLIHTLFLKFFYNVVGGMLLKNYTLGIALASITQMVLLSGMISYVHLFYKRLTLSKYIRVIFIVLSCLLPLFSMLSISMTKDVLFAGNVAVLFTLVAYWYRIPNYFSRRTNKIVFIVSIIGTILFRNYAVYLLALMLVALILQQLIIKQDNKLLIKLTFCGVLVGVLCQLLLSVGLKAGKGSINETLSLPYQQVVCTYYDKQDTLDEEDKILIEKMFPGLEYYRFDISDPIKGSAQIASYSNEFSALYLKLMIKHPDSYLKAFCNLNAGYLSVFDNSSGRIYGTDNRQGVFLSNETDGFGIEYKSRIPFIEKIYEVLFTENKYEDIFGLNFLCKSGLYIWVSIVLILVAFQKKKYELVPMIVFMICYLVALFAGPCSLIRYSFPYVLCVPILGACVFSEKMN